MVLFAVGVVALVLVGLGLGSSYSLQLGPSLPWRTWGWRWPERRLKRLWDGLARLLQEDGSSVER